MNKIYLNRYGTLNCDGIEIVYKNLYHIKESKNEVLGIVFPSFYDLYKFLGHFNGVIKIVAVDGAVKFIIEYLLLPINKEEKTIECKIANIERI